MRGASGIFLLAALLTAVVFCRTVLPMNCFIAQTSESGLVARNANVFLAWWPGAFLGWLSDPAHLARA